MRIRAVNLAVAAMGLTFIVAGCGQGSGSGGAQASKSRVELADVKPGEESSLMPLTEGSQWTYTVEEKVQIKATQRTGTGVVVYRVVKSEKTPNGTKATLELLSGNKVTNRQTLLMTPQGLYETANGADLKPLPAPQPLILFPPTKGRTFPWQGPSTIGADKPATAKALNTIEGPMVVDTDKGRYSAIAIQTHIDVSDGKTTATSDNMAWYSPNVGLVRLYVETKQPDGTMTRLLKLKTFSLKK